MNNDNIITMKIEARFLSVAKRRSAETAEAFAKGTNAEAYICRKMYAGHIVKKQYDCHHIGWELI